MKLLSPTCFSLFGGPNFIPIGMVLTLGGITWKHRSTNNGNDSDQNVSWAKENT